MKAIIERCCGIDVHKKQVVACVMKGKADSEPTRQVEKFATTTSGLKKLQRWLQQEGCTHVAMESTGSYWKPVFNILEEHFVVILANARHLKNVPGRKTDVKDCEWIAELLRHGLIPGSFIPPRNIRELRDLTRYRRKLLNMYSSEKNRIQKVLEDANIKLGNVLSDVFGASGQDMLEAIVEGRGEAKDIANFARGRLKAKREQIQEAASGTVTDHHRFLIEHMLSHMRFLEEEIQKIDEKIKQHLEPLKEDYERLQTIPGVGKTAAASIIAEIGTDMSQFPTSAHLSSWAGICPGNNESAGKKKCSRITSGNKWLKLTIVESAWSGRKKKNSYLNIKYHRIAARRGSKRAAVAVAHTILTYCYYLMKYKCYYQDFNFSELDAKIREKRKNYHLRCLNRLGYKADVTDADANSPPC